MASKDATIIFKAEDTDDTALRKKHPGRGTRSRVLRYLLKQYLDGKITVPTEVIKEWSSSY